MYVWNKRLGLGLVSAFAVFFILFELQGVGPESSMMTMHTTRWVTLNYFFILIWVFVWMIDQARMRGKNVWVWVVPFLLAPLPTLTLFIAFLQRRLKG